MKHCDRDLPDGLLSRIPGMSHDELNTALSRLSSTSADRNSSAQPGRQVDNGDSDDTQDPEVAAASSYMIRYDMRRF